MINRIAKVMWDDNRRILGGRLPEWNDIPTANQDMLRLRAKRVLEAIREPTETMMDCGARWVETAHMNESPEHAAKLVYMEMIDEAMR